MSELSEAQRGALIQLATKLAYEDIRFSQDLRGERLDAGVGVQDLALELEWTTEDVGRFERDPSDFTYRDGRLYALALTAIVLGRSNT